MTKTPTPTEKAKKQRDNTKTPPKSSITQRLRTDLGRSVGSYNSHPTGVVKKISKSEGESILSSKLTCLSSLTTFRPLLLMAFLFHNSNVTPI